MENENAVLALTVVGAIVSVALLSLVNGTILWLIWPVAIPVAFPALVASGALAGKLSWWASVCLTWIAGILVKASLTTKKNQ